VFKRSSVTIVFSNRYRPRLHVVTARNAGTPSSSHSTVYSVSSRSSEKKPSFAVTTKHASRVQGESIRG
jgi:hypothetical protein